MTLIPNSQTPDSSITGTDRGTDDILQSGNSADAMWGDASSLKIRASGGDDLITASSDGGLHIVYGDGLSMFDSSRGGNDTMTGGNGIFLAIDFPDGTGEIRLLSTRNIFTGDALAMHGNSRGGADTLTGGALAINEMSGDATVLDGFARGGKDVLIGGAGGRNYLSGDGSTGVETATGAGMSGYAQGGNDVLIAGDYVAAGAAYPANGLNFNVLIGDSATMSDCAVAGKDKLISGTCDDQMWGDAVTIIGENVTTAADVFVFRLGSGNDTVFDFRQADHDRIDVRGYGFDQMSDMAFIGNVIDFGGGNTLTLAGFSGVLTAADFILA